MPDTNMNTSSDVDHRETARIQEAERRRAEREAREAAEREELMEEEAGAGQTSPAFATNMNTSSGVDHREAARIREAERRRAEREAREAAQREEERQREELVEAEAGARREAEAAAARKARADALARAASERNARIAAENRRREAAQREEERQREELREAEAGARREAEAAALRKARADALARAANERNARMAAEKRREEEAAEREEERQREELREAEAGARREAEAAALRKARADALARAANERNARMAAEKRREEEAEAALLDEQTRQAERMRQGDVSLVPGFVTDAVVEAQSTGQPVESAVSLVPTASPVRLPEGGPRGRTFLAGDHLPRPGEVIEDPSTGQPAQLQLPNEDKDKPLRDTVRDYELQPLTEEGQEYLKFLIQDHIAITGEHPIPLGKEGFEKEAQEDEALWRREGPALEAAYTLFDAKTNLENAKKRLDKAQAGLESLSALDKPFSNLDPDSALAKEGARRHQQNLDQLQKERDEAQADYDFFGLVNAKVQAEVEASDAPVTPAHMKYVEDRKPLPESFLFFLPLGNVATNSLRAAREPKSDGGRAITEDEAKTIRRQRVGDVVAQLGTASTLIGGPGLVFNAGKGILGGAISKPLIGKIIKEAPMEILEESGFQASDIIFYREKFDLGGFAGEVAVESILQGLGSPGRGPRISGGIDAGTRAGPPELTADQLTALLSSTPTGRKALATLKQSSSTEPVMIDEDVDGNIVEGQVRYVKDSEVAGGETASLTLPAAQPFTLGPAEGPAPAALPAADQGSFVFDQAAALEGGAARIEPAADQEGSFVFDQAAALEGGAARTEPAADQEGSFVFDQAAALEGGAARTEPAADQEGSFVFDQAAALEGGAARTEPAADQGSFVFDEAAALEGGAARTEPAADQGSFVFDEAAALEQQDAASRQPQDMVIEGRVAGREPAGEGNPVFDEAAALEQQDAIGSRDLAFEEAAVFESGAAATFQESVAKEEAASDPSAALAPATPTLPAPAQQSVTGPGTALVPAQTDLVTDPGAAAGTDGTGIVGRAPTTNVGVGPDAGVGAGAELGVDQAQTGVNQAQTGANQAQAVDTTGRGQPDVEGSLAPSAAVVTDKEIQTTGEDPEVVELAVKKSEPVVPAKKPESVTPPDPIIVDPPIQPPPPVVPPAEVVVIKEKEIIVEKDPEIIVEKDPEIIVEKDPEIIVKKEETTAAAANENTKTQGRRRFGLPDIPDLTGLVPPSRPAQALPYSGPGFPNKAKYQVTSEIDLDLISGKTTSTLVDQTPIEIEGGALTPSPNRAYIGRNITLLTDDKGQAAHLDHPERRYRRTSADPSYLYTKSTRKSNKPKNSKGRSSRGRGGHDIKMMGPRRR